MLIAFDTDHLTKMISLTSDLGYSCHSSDNIHSHLRTHTESERRRLCAIDSLNEEFECVCDETRRTNERVVLHGLLLLDVAC